MNSVEINVRSPERMFRLMKHLNVLILLYITVISYHAVMGMARSNSAGLFLRTIPVLPLEIMRFVAAVVILYGTLLLLFSVEMEEDYMAYIKTAMELLISLMITAVCGMAYTGTVILVMTDVIHSSFTGQRKIRALIPIIFCYFIVNSGILSLWFRNVSFSDYLVFYNAGAAGILQSILNTMELVNIVMFIVFLILTLRCQMDETARILRLNEELTAANIMLEEYSRKSAEMAETRERNRLAREIHDTIGHALTGIVTGLEACLVILDMNPELARTQLEAIQETARQGMKDVRSSVSALRPDALVRLKFDAAIEQMIDDMCRSTGILFEYICEDSLSDLAVDEEDVIYRILQESITNSVRHGHPTRIFIRIERDDCQIRIRVEDNGGGCPEVRRGFGLTHMQERLDMLGGSMMTDGSDGFVLTALIPLRLHTGRGENND